MSRYLSLAFVLVAAACGAADAPVESTQPQPQAKAAGDDPHAVCVQAFQRQRECTDEFIPALVDARVRLNTPPGIAEKDAELGRDQLVSLALEEWEADSTDEAIEQTCTRMEGNMSPEQQQAAVDQVGECLAAEACSAFVDCLIPVIESTL
jgi:hypothetical protein